MQYFTLKGSIAGEWEGGAGQLVRSYAHNQPVIRGGGGEVAEYNCKVLHSPVIIQ